MYPASRPPLPPGLPAEHVQFYTAGIVEGLGFLHDNGIAYRDVKAENVMLDTDGERSMDTSDFGHGDAVRDEARSSPYLPIFAHICPYLFIFVVILFLAVGTYNESFRRTFYFTHVHPHYACVRYNPQGFARGYGLLYFKSGVNRWSEQQAFVFHRGRGRNIPSSLGNGAVARHRWSGAARSTAQTEHGGASRWARG